MSASKLFFSILELPPKPRILKLCRAENKEEIIVTIQNPSEKNGPSRTDAILVSYQFSEAHRLKENPIFTVRANKLLFKQAQKLCLAA